MKQIFPWSDFRGRHLWCSVLGVITWRTTQCRQIKQEKLRKEIQVELKKTAVVSTELILQALSSSLLCLKPGNSVEQCCIYLKLRLKLKTAYSSDSGTLLSHFKHPAWGAGTKPPSELPVWRGWIIEEQSKELKRSCFLLSNHSKFAFCSILRDLWSLQKGFSLI